jgi:hypothetical protein
MQFVRTDRARDATDLFAVGRDAHVIASTISTPAHAGFPLHLTNREGQVISSFGVDDPTLDPRKLEATGDLRQTFLDRQLVPGAAGTFWSYNPTRFLLQQYDFSGRLLAHARHGLDGWYAGATERKPSRGEHKGLQLMAVVPSVDSSMLWLVYADRNASFKDPDSSRMGTANPWFGMHDIVVEAFDVRNFQVLAMRRFPGASVVRVGHAPDILAFYDETAAGSEFPVYRITRLTLSRPLR